MFFQSLVTNHRAYWRSSLQLAFWILIVGTLSVKRISAGVNDKRESPLTYPQHHVGLNKNSIYQKQTSKTNWFFLKTLNTKSWNKPYPQNSWKLYQTSQTHQKSRFNILSYIWNLRDLPSSTTVWSTNWCSVTASPGAPMASIKVPKVDSDDSKAKPPISGGSFSAKQSDFPWKRWNNWSNKTKKEVKNWTKQIVEKPMTHPKITYFSTVLL